MKRQRQITVAGEQRSGQEAAMAARCARPLELAAIVWQLATGWLGWTDESAEAVLDTTIAGCCCLSGTRGPGAEQEAITMRELRAPVVLGLNC